MTHNTIMHGLPICRRAAVTAVAVVALLLPATTLGAAGSLDRSFHGTGRLAIKVARPTNGRTFEVTRLESTPTLSTAGPKGELVVAEDRRVLRYRADGRPQKRFGGNGRAAIPTPAGMSFRLAGVAVDSRGRVLVASPSPASAAAEGLASDRKRFAI